MSKGQSRKGSFVEALANIVVGVAVAFTSQLIIFHYYGVHISLGQNAEMTAWFTLVSLIRSFTLRRFFNWLTVRKPRPYQYPYGSVLRPVDVWNNLTRDGRCQ